MTSGQRLPVDRESWCWTVFSGLMQRDSESASTAKGEPHRAAAIEQGKPATRPPPRRSNLPAPKENHDKNSVPATRKTEIHRKHDYNWQY